MITNNGKAAISSIQVSEKLPDKLLFAEKELSQGTTYDEVTGLWTIPVLEAGAQGNAGGQERGDGRQGGPKPG